MVNKNRSVIKLLIIFIATFASVSCNNSSTKNTTAKHTGDTAIKETSNTNNKTSSNSTTTNTNWLLVPGVAAGQTKINENADSVYQRLGIPDGGDAAMMKAVAIWYAHHDSTGYATAIYTAKNTDSPVVASVLQIRVTSPAFKTGEGIGTTSSLQDIQRHFAVQKAEQYTNAGNSYTVYDSNEGIAFEMNADAACVAIIIHKAGANNLGTYLKFRTTNKFIDKRK